MRPHGVGIISSARSETIWGSDVESIAEKGQWPFGVVRRPISLGRIDLKPTCSFGRNLKLQYLAACERM
jgi:hypothetical protein